MKNRAKSFFTALLTICLLIGCQSPPAAQPQGQAPETGEEPALRITPPLGLEVSDCWFDVPAGARVTCGYVNVPEDHSQSMTEDNTLKLALAIFHSSSATPAPDPLIYQLGGPGGHMLVIAPQLYDKVITPFLESRDLILFDPRGTGYSQPALECKNEEVPGTCLHRLFTEGHNIYAYSSVSMAEDLQDLRVALGYNHWNLLGESYGTHVAQVTLQKAPQGLRSVILDSVMPVVLPELPDRKTTFEAALQRLFRQCQENPDCQTAYPNLPDALEKAILRLDANPVTLRTMCYGQEKVALLTGDRLISMTFHALYETELVPELPHAITAAAEGTDYSFWNKVVCWETVIDSLLAEGAHWAIQCSDGRLGDDCEDWPVAVRQSAVSSGIPVLILSGEFDPVTPMEYGHSVARSLPNSYVFDFPGTGHWVNGTGHSCQSRIIQAFLDDPTQAPDAQCIKTIPPVSFYTPAQAGAALLDDQGDIR